MVLVHLIHGPKSGLKVISNPMNLNPMVGSSLTMLTKLLILNLTLIVLILETELKTLECSEEYLLSVTPIIGMVNLTLKKPSQTLPHIMEEELFMKSINSTIPKTEEKVGNGLKEIQLTKMKMMYLQSKSESTIMN